jgi:hypothetical protein
MTLNAVFKVDGIPCLIADYLETGDAPANIAVPTYPDVEAIIPANMFKVSGLVRKSALIEPGIVVAASGNASAAKRAIDRLYANFEGERPTKERFALALKQMDDLATNSCTLIGWLLDGDRPTSFRWNSKSYRKLQFDGDFTEGSGRSLYEEVAPRPGGFHISNLEVFEGASEFCLHQTATLWANELLRGNTLRDRFGAGYDIFVFNDGHFRLLEECTYLLFLMDFEEATGGGVTYRIWTQPIYTKTSYIYDHCIIRVLLPPNVMRIQVSESERLGIIPPLMRSPSARAAGNADMPFRNMPLTSRRYACCWFGETASGVPEVFTAIASREDAAKFKIYVAGQRGDGLDEIKFELPGIIMQNMAAAAVAKFERDGTRLVIKR